MRCLCNRLLYGLDEPRGAKLHWPDLVYNHQFCLFDRALDRQDTDLLKVTKVEAVRAERWAVGVVEVGEDPFFACGKVADSKPHPSAALPDLSRDHPSADQGCALRNPRGEGRLPYPGVSRDRDLHRTNGIVAAR